MIRSEIALGMVFSKLFPLPIQLTLQKKRCDRHNSRQPGVLYVTPTWAGSKPLSNWHGFIDVEWSLLSTGLSHSWCSGTSLEPLLLRIGFLFTVITCPPLPIKAQDHLDWKPNRRETLIIDLISRCFLKTEIAIKQWKHGVFFKWVTRKYSFHTKILRVGIQELVLILSFLWPLYHLAQMGGYQ